MGRPIPDSLMPCWDMTDFCDHILAAALFWQDMLGDPVTLASYDRQLWEAAKANGLIAWPGSLP